MKHRIDVISQSLRPKGATPPFTRKMTAAEALRWWLQHRYDQLGLNLVAGMQPVQVAALDAWLAQAMQASGVQTEPQAEPLKLQAPQGGERILTRAMGLEQRNEGPPVGSEDA